MCNTIEEDSNQEVPNDPENANSNSTTNLNGWPNVGLCLL